MRTFLQHQSLVGCLLVLALLFGGQGHAGDFIWCIADGDAHIEPAGKSGGECGEDGAGHHDHLPAPAIAATAASCCGPCLDLPIPHDSLSQRSQLSKAGAAPLSATVIPLAVSRTPERPQPTLFLQPPATTTIVQRVLHVTILLI